MVSYRYCVLFWLISVFHTNKIQIYVVQDWISTWIVHLNSSITMYCNLNAKLAHNSESTQHNLTQAVANSVHVYIFQCRHLLNEDITSKYLAYRYWKDGLGDRASFNLQSTNGHALIGMKTGRVLELGNVLLREQTHNPTAECR